MPLPSYLTRDQERLMPCPSMTPLEAANRMYEQGGYSPEGRCVFCCYDMIAKQPHAIVCPILALPQIVAALEASQAFVDSTPDPRQWGHMVRLDEVDRHPDAVRALFAAMKPRTALKGQEF